MIEAALFVHDHGEFLPDGIVEQREDTHRIPVDPVREGHRAAHFPDLHAVAQKHENAPVTLQRRIVLCRT